MLLRAAACQSASSPGVTVKSNAMSMLTSLISDVRSRFEYNLIEVDDEGQVQILGMDSAGKLLRFISFSIKRSCLEIKFDRTVDTYEILSVEKVVRERSTVSAVSNARKIGTAKRALAGYLLLGNIGAVVGASSARAETKTTMVSQKDYVCSELVLGLSALQTPVLYFAVSDPAEADRWLHRIRVAMVKNKQGEARAEVPVLDISVGNTRQASIV